MHTKTVDPVSHVLLILLIDGYRTSSKEPTELSVMRLEATKGSWTFVHLSGKKIVGTETIMAMAARVCNI